MQLQKQGQDWQGRSVLENPIGIETYQASHLKKDPQRSRSVLENPIGIETTR